jgi:hypothetical protein
MLPGISEAARPNFSGGEETETQRALLLRLWEKVQEVLR